MHRPPSRPTGDSTALRLRFSALLTGASLTLLASASGCKPLATEKRRQRGTDIPTRAQSGNNATYANGVPVWQATSNDGVVYVPGLAALDDIQDLGTDFDLDVSTPRAAENYVFVPNASGKQVVAIDSERLLIRSVETGNGPTHLKTVPGQDAALVINADSGDLSLIRVDEAGTLSEQRLPIIAGANDIAVSPTGQSAVVFFNADNGVLANGEVQSVSVLNLTEGEASSNTVTVSFKPEHVEYTADGEQAFVICKDAISKLDIEHIATEGPGIADNVTFNADTLVNSEIVITADGRYAIGHLAQGVDLRVLDLQTGELAITPLWYALLADDLTSAERENIDEAIAAGEDPPPWAFPLRPSILSLHYDASSGQLLVAIDGFNAVVTLPIPTGFTDLRLADVLDIGIAADKIVGGESARYFVAYLSERGFFPALTVIDLRAPTGAGADEVDAGVADDAMPTHHLTLEKPVQNVSISPGGNFAVVQLSHRSGDPTEMGLSAEESLARSPAYMLLNMDTLATKLELTKGDISEVVFSSDNRYAFLLFNDTVRRTNRDGERQQIDVREVHRVNLQRFVTESIYRLDSDPLSGAAVPGETRVFISQSHRDGRLTFIDWETGKVETVTGLELNSRIQN